MLTVKYKQRIQKLKADTKQFVNIESNRPANTSDMSLNNLRKSRTSEQVLESQGFQSNSILNYYDESARSVKFNLTQDTASQTNLVNTQTTLQLEKGAHLKSKNTNKQLSEQLEQLKIALRETTAQLREKDREISKLKKSSLPIESNIPRPATPKENKQYMRIHDLCQHLHQQFDDKSVLIRRSVSERIQKIFENQILKSNIYSPTLDEYLSQKDVCLVTYKLKSLTVFGLLSENVRIKTNDSTRFANVKQLIKQIASEWHTKHSITHLLGTLKPQTMIIFKNGDFKLSFESQSFVYIYKNGVAYYEDGGSVYLYPDCELRIIKGETYCSYYN